MNNVRTVSDTKKTFYSLHTRPINTIYRRVVEELMVEMHLLSVNVDFSYNGIYALGVVTAFDRFMDGYQPERDKESIFNAICRAVEQDPQRYREDASRLQSIAASLPGQDLIAGLTQSATLQNQDLQDQLQGIIANANFKYSRLLAIGLFSLLEKADPEIVKDAQQRADTLKAIANGLHLSEDKLSKDLELYSSNLEKIAQALIVMEDILSADRKKRDKRQQELNTSAS
ncbi:photosystem II biogenesis protein Psp29 [Anabaena sp. FACHB-1237]|uniref:photosystem II biogenesis protein Psp29 n=1 Tax=Anabaena sp. FACHB-1237 TaxID=2692769 RepID=UPI0016808AA1|nr:photosystem II biogenesis protein Psp29 [Anabaena sp. FACHB-1237]MBD2136064.1 photosystem II biogenesis protein Psp29 [Anabaena sp. FACHB-1237]